MDREFYTISVYVDKDENLIGIPCGDSDKYGIADIDTVMLLKAPYTDSALENYINKVLDACYTKKHNDNVETSTIERYTKKKGFVNATKDFTMISIVKTRTNYSLMPTFNDYEKGPLAIDDDEHILLLNHNPGEMAEVIRGFIEVYLKANMFYKEKAELEAEKAEKQNS
ncbi:hypothetical protein [uncultured Eubacterium sp.]|uniref:hypothetical protein n=1 Tax=uncultured Eubacterium sp. TaxID=165185 RepID=UPI0015BFAF53|nr:hypothetical protein [uncultured Eubacterium sp.]